MAKRKQYSTGTKKYYIDENGYKHDRKTRDKLTNEYKARTYHRVALLIRKEETDVIKKLESVESKTQYIIDLIKKDIEASK